MVEENAILGQIFNKLINHYGKLRQSLSKIEEQSQSIRILSFNSSIEAARAGQAGKGFQVIAQEIRKISESNKTVNDACNAVVNDIETQMNELIGIRTADVAFDTIDKIDRNLFERYCDVQAWATFGKIREACKEPTQEKCVKACKTLAHLVQVYEVYYDIILADLDGNIIATGVQNNIIGNNVTQKDWFSEVKNTKQTFYSDMYHSSSMNAHVMTYACPVVDEDGVMVGVISTRFNWNFVLDIVNSAKIENTSSIYLINKDGLVIASKKSDEILNKKLTFNEAFVQIQHGKTYGYCFNAKQFQKSIIGYAKTKGYNSYKGKDWSIIIEEKY